MTQLTTPEIIVGAVVAIEGVLSFLSAVLPKASGEETIVNDILNLIHGAGFNSGKIVQPKSKTDLALNDKALSILESASTLLKDLETPASSATPSDFAMADKTPITPIAPTPNTPPNYSVNLATPQAH